MRNLITMKILSNNQLIFLFSLFLSCLQAQESIGFVSSEATGSEIMKEVDRRHQQFPYIYEEQSMIMEDRSGHRDTRKARRYSRVEEDGSVKFLLLFDSPQEVKGVALLANRAPDGKIRKYIYLPAYGEQLLESAGERSGDNFLGTDFSVENLTGEILSTTIMCAVKTRKRIKLSTLFWMFIRPVTLHLRGKYCAAILFNRIIYISL